MKRPERSTAKQLEWTSVARWAFCVIAAALTGVALSLQGNSWIWSGFYFGVLVGLLWSVIVLFGVPGLSRVVWPSLRHGPVMASWLVAFAILAAICIQIWR